MKSLSFRNTCKLFAFVAFFIFSVGGVGVRSAYWPWHVVSLMRCVVAVIFIWSNLLFRVSALQSSPPFAISCKYLVNSATMKVTIGTFLWFRPVTHGICAKSCGRWQNWSILRCDGYRHSRGHHWRDNTVRDTWWNWHYQWVCDKIPALPLIACKQLKLVSFVSELQPLLSYLCRGGSSFTLKTSGNCRLCHLSFDLIITLTFRHLSGDIRIIIYERISIDQVCEAHFRRFEGFVALW